MEALRCASKMQVLGNRDKVAKMSQFDVPIHIQNILIQLNKILDVSMHRSRLLLKHFRNAISFFNGSYEQLSLAESCANSVASVYTVAKNAIGGRRDATTDEIMSEQQAASLPQSRFDHCSREEDATAFRTLNEEWIARYFTLEPKDRGNPGRSEGKILKQVGISSWSGSAIRQLAASL